MNESVNSFVPLLSVVILSLMVPLTITRFRRLALPIVVGEILAGVIVGRSGLGLVAHGDAMLNLLSEFGFVFLMFLAGLEIDFSNISAGQGSKGKRTSALAIGPVTLSILVFLLTLALSAAIGLMMVKQGLVRDMWMMALILSTTSLGVVMPVLKENNMTGSRYGQALLLSALVADFATMLLITVEVAALSGGVTLDILLISFLFVVFFLVYRLGIFSFNRVELVRRTLEELSQTTARIKIRGAFAMMLLFVALSEILGAEVILGAFLAGAMISLLSTHEDLEAMHQLEAIGFGFFIPIFFIMVGVEFNIRSLLESPQALVLLPLLLASAVAVKTIPFLLYRFNFTWRETLAAGILSSSRLSLIIAASAIGLRLGIISESVNAAVILVAIISVTAAPLIFQRMIPRQTAEVRPPVVVFGAGQVGLLVSQQLRAHHEQVVLVDTDADRVNRTQGKANDGLQILHSLPGEENSTLAGILDQAKTVVVTYSDIDICRTVCQHIRQHYGIEHIVALVNDINAVAELEKLNVHVVNPSLDQASLLTMLARNPTMYQLLTRTDDNAEVVDVVVQKSALFGQALRALPLPGDVLIVAMRRDGEFVVPRGNTTLEAQDHLTLLGSGDHLENARALFT